MEEAMSSASQLTATASSERWSDKICKPQELNYAVGKKKKKHLNLLFSLTNKAEKAAGPKSLPRDFRKYFTASVSCSLLQYSVYPLFQCWNGTMCRQTLVCIVLITLFSDKHSDTMMTVILICSPSPRVKSSNKKSWTSSDKFNVCPNAYKAKLTRWVRNSTQKVNHNVILWLLAKSTSLTPDSVCADVSCVYQKNLLLAIHHVGWHDVWMQQRTE